jgi:hypothetical protein
MIGYNYKINVWVLFVLQQDKRLTSLKSSDELAYEGNRISLTFRSIATFAKKLECLGEYDGPEKVIYGQGARRKNKPSDEELISMNCREDDVAVQKECLRLLTAFSAENRLAEFDWPAYYSAGFDAIDIIVND